MKARELAEMLMKWPDGEVLVIDVVKGEHTILWIDKDASDDKGECTVIIAVE